MDNWRGVIAGLMYMLQFRENPRDDVEMLYRAIQNGNAIVFSPPEIHEAVIQALAYDKDLSQLLPPNLISIATDPAENRILLSIAGDDAGKVYYWSWDEEPKKPTGSYKYIRLISNSFDKFISTLR